VHVVAVDVIGVKVRGQSLIMAGGVDLDSDLEPYSTRAVPILLFLKKVSVLFSLCAYLKIKN
jgi:hypothetical protein